VLAAAIEADVQIPGTEHQKRIGTIVGTTSGVVSSVEAPQGFLRFEVISITLLKGPPD
jgi:hypothetical protein